MSERLRYLHDANRPDLRLIAKALRQAGTWLDNADAQTESELHPLLSDDHTALEWAHAWMAAAIYIADMTDVVTAALDEVSYELDRQCPQPALF